MAAGTFVQGASIEFSADGPLRAPYTLYLQGGLTYAHVKVAIAKAVEATFFS
jgi:cystathionine beta-lyase family protein involved in aluminum resistance